MPKALPRAIPSRARHAGQSRQETCGGIHAQDPVRHPIPGMTAGQARQETCDGTHAQGTPARHPLPGMACGAQPAGSPPYPPKPSRAGAGVAPGAAVAWMVPGVVAGGDGRRSRRGGRRGRRGGRCRGRRSRRGVGGGRGGVVAAFEDGLQLRHHLLVGQAELEDHAARGRLVLRAVRVVDEVAEGAAIGRGYIAQVRALSGGDVGVVIRQHIAGHVVGALLGEQQVSM